MGGTSAVTFGEPGTASAAYQISHLSTRSFDEVVIRLRKEIDRAGLRLLHEIDPQKAVQGIGQCIGGSRLIFFFHPKLVVRVFEADWSAMVEAPLKLVVTELPDRTVSVRMADPIIAFGRHGNDALAELGRELAAQCQEIIASSI